MAKERTVPQEDARNASGARWIDALAADLRFAVRYFGRQKLTAATIVAVLALGIGANTVIFTMFQAELMRPAPAVPKDDAHVRIYALQRTDRSPWQGSSFSQPEMSALAARKETFETVAGWIAHEVVFDAGDSTGARGVVAQFVTPNFFAALGVPLVAGQGFTRDTSDAADMAAIMAFAVAQQMYGDPRSAVGRQILVNELPLRVVGVAPPAFQGALRNMQDPVVWMPVSARDDIARVSPKWLEGSALDLFARLAPGVSREQAEAIARQAIARALPDSAAQARIARMAWVRDMHEPEPGNNTYEAYLAFAAISAIGLLILLVTCTNVSSLMVAAAVARRHEIAVRLSLGATRGRILRQLVTETTLLAIAGGTAGLLLCWWLVTWLARNEVEGVNITPDVGTVAFMMLVSLGTGILFGLSPALHATRWGAATALKDSGTGTTRQSRLQRVFVVAQIVFSQPLLVLLGVTLSLVIRDYQPLRPEVSERVIRLSFRPLTQTGTPGQRREAVDSLIPRIASQPEVIGVVPEATAFTLRKIIEPHAADGVAPADTAPTTLNVEGAAPGWFALQDVPILLGRDVSLADTAERNWPVVIGSNLSRTLWGDANPIGRTLPSPAWPGRTDSVSMSVVGVYDETLATTRGNSVPRVYTAYDKQWRRDVLLVRTRGSAEAFMPALQVFVRAQAPGLPVSRIRTIAQIDAQERLVTLRVAALAGSGGAVALLLASLGLYGVIGLAVQQRTREIGIRIAVGANPMRVARMFLASGVRLGSVALAIGLPLSLIALRVALSVQGFHLGPVNVWLIGGGIAAVLLAVASAATWLPARRAARVDPAITLRTE